MARAAACCVCVRHAGTFQYSERTVPFPASSVSATHQILFLHGVPVLVLVARPCPVLQTSFLFDIPKRRAAVSSSACVCLFTCNMCMHMHASALLFSPCSQRVRSLHAAVDAGRGRGGLFRGHRGAACAAGPEVNVADPLSTPESQRTLLDFSVPSSVQPLDPGAGAGAPDALRCDASMRKRANLHEIFFLQTPTEVGDGGYGAGAKQTGLRLNPHPVHPHSHLASSPRIQRVASSSRPPRASAARRRHGEKRKQASRQPKTGEANDAAGANGGGGR